MASSKKDLLAFPDRALREAGYQLGFVQLGEDPTNFSPMPQIGSGVFEIRVDEDTDTFRVLYVAKFEEAIYVLHCFKKKSKRGKATPKKDLNKAIERYKEVVQNRPALSG
jgi:phage-related protein